MPGWSGSNVEGFKKGKRWTPWSSISAPASLKGNSSCFQCLWSFTNRKELMSHVLCIVHSLSLFLTNSIKTLYKSSNKKGLFSESCFQRLLKPFCNRRYSVSMETVMLHKWDSSVMWGCRNDAFSFCSLLLSVLKVGSVSKPKCVAHGQTIKGWTMGVHPFTPHVCYGFRKSVCPWRCSGNTGSGVVNYCISVTRIVVLPSVNQVLHNITQFLMWTNVFVADQFILKFPLKLCWKETNWLLLIC